MLRRDEPLGGVHAEDGGGIRTELVAQGRFVLCRAEAGWKAPIDERPALIPVRAEKHGDGREGTALE